MLDLKSKFVIDPRFLSSLEIAFGKELAVVIKKVPNWDKNDFRIPLFHVRIKPISTQSLVTAHFNPEKLMDQFDNFLLPYNLF